MTIDEPMDRGNTVEQERDHALAKAEPILCIHNLGVAFGPRVVLADVDLTVWGPGITVLMGPGGTGKSTLLHRLARMPASTRMRQWGSVEYQGHPLEQTRAAPAVIHQHARDLGVRLIESLSASLRDAIPETGLAELRQIVLARLDTYGLSDLAPLLDATVADLTQGQIRLAGVLRSAFSGAPLILLDEPTTGLNEADADRVLALIEHLGQEHACLVTLHNQRQARRIAQWAALLAGGRIQVAAGAGDFFGNASGHPVLAQFLRTGSCSVPAPDAQPEQLAADVAPPPPLPTMASAEIPNTLPPIRTAPSSTETAQPSVAPLVAKDDSPSPSLLPASASILAKPDAPAETRGPQGFHWLIPGRLAGCPMPGVVVPLGHDLALLRRMGITMLINLTERELPNDTLAKYGIRSYGMPVEDRHAPPLMWTKLLLAKMGGFMRANEVLAVHCLAGLGRTGTILCAWLIREGLTAEEALRRLRRIDPGFVQSQPQEDLLHELEQNLLILAK